MICIRGILRSIPVYRASRAIIEWLFRTKFSQRGRIAAKKLAGAVPQMIGWVSLPCILRNANLPIGELDGGNQEIGAPSDNGDSGRSWPLSQARAASQSRFTVIGVTPIAQAVSSMDNPPK